MAKPEEAGRPRIQKFDGGIFEVTAVSFTVLGDPKGHVAVTQRSKWKDPRAEEIAAYKETVRRSAMAAKVHIPVTSSNYHPILIHTKAFFKNKLHSDPESVHRAVKDALWPHKNGGDKYTGGRYDFPLYDPDKPRVEVEVRW